MKYILSLFILLSPGILFAESYPYSAASRELRPRGMSISSNTDAHSTNVIVASASAILYTLNVNAAGTNSWLEIFDSNISTSDQTRSLGLFSTTATISIRLGGPYGHYMSSGTAWFNRANPGGTPADVTLFYELK